MDPRPGGAAMATLRFIQALLVLCAALLVLLIWRGSWYAAAVLCLVAALFIAGLGVRRHLSPNGAPRSAFRPRIHWRNDAEDPEAANDTKYRTD